MVPAIGLEPIRLLQLGILSPVRLPIPPRGHVSNTREHYSKIFIACQGKYFDWQKLFFQSKVNNVLIFFVDINFCAFRLDELQKRITLCR